MCNREIKIVKKIPIEGIFWTANPFFTESITMYYVWTILLHILLAIIIDLILKFLGRKSM